MKLSQSDSISLGNVKHEQKHKCIKNMLILTFQMRVPPSERRSTSLQSTWGLPGLWPSCSYIIQFFNWFMIYHNFLHFSLKGIWTKLSFNLVCLWLSFYKGYLLTSQVKFLKNLLIKKLLLLPNDVSSIITKLCWLLASQCSNIV